MSIKRTVNNYFPFVFLVIPGTWAGSFIAGKYVVEGIDPLSAVFWRFLLSALVMFPPLLLFYRHRHPDLKEFSYLKHLIIVTLSAGIIYHSLMFWALETTSPTNTALIIALNPFFTAFAEIFLFRVKQKTRFYIGFLIAFFGAIWVNISRGEGLTMPGSGELICVLASLTWSFYSLYAKKTKQPEWDPIWLGAYSYSLTALLILPFLSKPVFFLNLAEISGMVWMGLWYMAVFPTAIGYTLYYIGVQKKGPAWAATYIYLIPSATANLDHLFFNAAFTLPMVTGTTLVVIGLIIGNISRQQLSMVLAWIKKKE